MNLGRSVQYFSIAKSKGFSIVELMVAILIGLIILAGVIQVVFTSRTTFFAQEEMSYIQENARYALDVLGKDIQSAGYWGCAGESATMSLVANVNANSVSFMGPEPLIGFEGEINTNSFPEIYRGNNREIFEPNSTTHQDFPDSILIRRAAGVPVSIVSHIGQTLVVEPAHSFAPGDFITLIAEDCRRMGVIRAATAAGTGITYSTGAGGTVCNNSIKPGLEAGVTCTSGSSSAGSYLPGSVAMDYVAHAYYIDDSSALNDQPALKRMELRGIEGKAIEQEIALGVEDLEILYGIGTSTGNYFIKADEVTNWNEVVSVQVSLLFRAQTPSLNVDQQVSFLGNDYNDRYMRQVVTSTFRLRNRI